MNNHRIVNVKLTNLVLIRKILLLINKHMPEKSAFHFSCDLNRMFRDNDVDVVTIVEGDGMKAYNMYENPYSPKKK